MIYYVTNRILNFTYSLTHSLTHALCSCERLSRYWIQPMLMKSYCISECQKDIANGKCKHSRTENTRTQREHLSGNLLRRSSANSSCAQLQHIHRQSSRQQGSSPRSPTKQECHTHCISQWVYTQNTAGFSSSPETRDPESRPRRLR